MKVIFLILISMLPVSKPMWAQQPANQSRLNLSLEMKEPSNSTIDDYLGEDENGFYVLRRREKNATPLFGNYTSYLVESYSNDLQLKKRQDVEPVLNGITGELDAVKYVDGRLYAYFLFLNRKENTTELYYQSIDKKTLLLTGSAVRIAAIPYDNRNKQGDIHYKISLDHKSIAILAALHDDKKTNETFTASVYDGNMKQIWTKDITLPYNSELFEREKLLLDNHGNLYLSGRLYVEKAKEKRKGVANYSYKILAYRDAGTVSKEYDITAENQFITDLGFNITQDDKLAVAGFYSAKGTYSIRGVSFTLIDAASGSILRQGSQPFNADFVELFSRSQVYEKGSEIYNYNLDNIIIRSDGGALLLSEQFYVEARTTSYYNGYSYTTRITYYYHYNDVIAININPDLTIAWANKVAKRQLTTNDGGYYSSYAYAVAGDKIYLIFNDNPDNLKITDPSKLAKYSGVKRSVATLVTISTDGSWKKSLLFSNKDQGAILRPKICEQTGTNTVFLYAEKGKNYVIGKANL